MSDRLPEMNHVNGHIDGLPIENHKPPDFEWNTETEVQLFYSMIGHKPVADTHLGASTVHRLWRRWLEQGNVAIYRNVGATRVTSARVDRHILRQAVAAPQATCTAILQHVQDTLDHSILTRTISRRLVANGLHSCRPLRRLPLTPPNRHQRLEWCRSRSTWMTEWHRVVFSDESRFCLSSDSRRVRVWRRHGERSNPAAIVERPTV
ncbi:hypothetical protein LAZ67_18001453 [Cordylochernes scorpioides]|uniref:Transposase Tc1-like domain-containing protein n=1 Tax=Cordylochernes scorpioides TaxID=51811 RepID=A0ABY6LJI1_9ARAC|nr:hypothetical protein LAZ67_18001453 [Cordylochernes scorpioides]